MGNQRNFSVQRPTLRHSDQRDLEWFFVEGAVAFDKSPMGPMLDRAELFTFGPMICPACNGQGYQGDPEQKIREAIEKARRLEAELAARGESLASSLRRWRAENGKERPPWYDDGQCAACAGCGWIPRTVKFDADNWKAKAKATAYPMGSSVDEHGGRNYPLEADMDTDARPTGSSIKKSGGKEPPGELLERYGLVSRRISRLSAAHRATMEAFFGLAGLRWAEDRYRGRIWGVMPLTPAGRKLVKQSRAKGSGGSVLTDDQVLNVEAELQKQKPTKTRGALLAAAREQALAYLSAAESAWRRDKPAMVSATELLGKIRETLGRIAS